MADPEGALWLNATELASRAPLPAAATNIVCGTAGWTDPTLIKSGLFYPKNAHNPQARLQFYAQHFSVVEVDATYYTLVSEQTVERWVGNTPAGFLFHIKAHPVFTGHPIDVSRLPKDLKHALSELGFDTRVYPRKLPAELVQTLEQRFFAPLAALDRAHKLGAVLLQYPPWFAATRGHVRAIEAVRARYPDVRFAVEFRHKSWLEPERRQRVLDLLRAQHMTYVCVDEPPGAVGGVPPLAAVTTPELAFIRFHGKNRAGWAKKGATVHERFDYLYSEAELMAWVEPARRLAQNAERVHAVFNNCVRNYAVLNAKGFSVLLGVPPEPC